jgi:hypothetical protein
MGGAKNYAMQIEEQGRSPTPDKWVCDHCINEPFLARKVSDAVTSTQVCSFCEQHPAAELDVLVEAFMVGVFARYDDAYGTLPYDSEDGQYIGRTLETWELIGEYCHIFGDSPGLQDAVCEAVHDRTWSDSYYWHHSPSEGLLGVWNQFCESVKYESRYVFWLRQDWQEPDYEYGSIPRGQFLTTLSQFIDDYGLYRTTDIGHTYWRARTHSEDAPSLDAKELGTAGREHAKQANRMSPAGIPMFYGAEDLDTAIQESLVRTSDTHVSAASFIATQHATLIDLRSERLPEPPSEFDTERASERTSILFLRDFLKQLTEPVRSSFEQIDYVPTQIVTEYLLKVHQHEGASAHGLLYTSAVTAQPCRPGRSQQAMHRPG